MKTFAFRFISDDGVPTGYYGVVGANSERDLFWSIDEFGDPFRCELQKLSNIGFCLKLSKGFLDDDCCMDDPYSALEISENILSTFISPEKFRKAVWSPEKFRKAVWSKEMIGNLYSR